MGGDTDDAGYGTRWMLYSELAAARGITNDSARRMAFRKGWKRQVGNDGLARVSVPHADQLPPPDAPHDGPKDAAALQRERQRADQAEAGRAEAEARAGRAEAELAEARAHADQLAADRDQVRQDREDARVRAASAEGEARALREALALLAQPSPAGSVRAAVRDWITRLLRPPA